MSYMNHATNSNTDRPCESGFQTTTPHSLHATPQHTSSGLGCNQSTGGGCNATESMHGEDDGFPEKEHPTLARAIASYDWDGTIPSRRTRGIAVKRGSPLEICRVINLEWCQVHDQGQCKYIPSAFLNVTSVCDKRFEAYLAGLASPGLGNLPSVTQKHPFRRFFSFVTSLLCFSPASDNNTTRGPFYNKRSTPAIPKPPFDKEPYMATPDGSQITVNVDCKPVRGRGVAITFSLDMLPAPGSRFTGLTFDAILPGGYLISGMFPEQQQGHPTEIQQRHLRASVLTSTAHGVPSLFPRFATTAGTRDGTAHSVEYTRATKSTIRGGGINTSRATWVAAEDIGSRSGLEGQMKFSLLLGTHNCPPAIKYVLSVESEGRPSRQGEPAWAKTWKSPWIEESLP